MTWVQSKAFVGVFKDIKLLTAKHVLQLNQDVTEILLASPEDQRET